MSQPCSTCGYQNSAGSVFCVRCGSKVEATQAYQQSSSSAPPKSSSGAGNTGNFANAGYPSSAPLGYQAQGAQAQTMATFSSAPVQMGSTSGAVAGSTAPHAFAGRGSLITHHAWLLFGEYSNATHLRSAIMEILRLRNFQPLKVNAEKLRESGHWTEEREYITMQRGVTTVFVYVAPAGQDLYISRATTVQLSFDPVRIVIFVCAVGEVFFGPSIMQAIVGNIISSAVGSPMSALGLVVPIIIIIGLLGLLYIPSIIFLATFLIASLKHWFAEKDFWIYLRRNYLHDFEIDDVMLLEHATDEGVLAAGKQLHLDATKIGPPVQGYQTKRRVRAI